MAERYLIALGSNVRHHRHGRPEQVLRVALEKLDERRGLKVVRASLVIASPPMGPSRRRYANAVAVVKTKLEPDELLDVLKRMERKFGRRSGGQRWGSRVLDLDIVLWKGGSWASQALTIPHPAFRQRNFVLKPAACIAADWRDPVTGFSVRQLLARLTRPRALPR